MEINLIQTLVTILLFIKMEPNDSSNVTLVGADGQTEAHEVCSASNSTEEHFETTGNVTTEEGLSRQQKQCLSRLYRTGEKKLC